MTSDAYYIQVLPDYAYNDVMSTSADKQHHAPADDDDYEDAEVKSRDVIVTSLYEHPQLSESVDGQQRHRSTYQRLKPSRRLPSNDLQLMTSDMSYDEIVDIPSPPPLRPGWTINSVSVNSFIYDSVRGLCFD